MSDAFRYSKPARTPAVIGLYETQCKEKLYREYGFTSQGLPNSYALTLAVFDRAKASNIWYEWYPEIMDLFGRYNLSTTNEDGSPIPMNDWCPTVLFQPADWNKPVIKFNPSTDGSFVQWVWSHLAIEEITFRNTLDKQVNLVIKSSDEHSKDMVNEAVLAQIPAGESTTLTPTEIGTTLHGGDTIVIVDGEDNVINRYLLNTVDLEIDITQTNDKQITDEKKYQAKMDNAVKLRNSRDWSTRRRYLNNIRTPPFMPHFTEMGFKYMEKMPQDICDYLKQYHKETILIGNKKRVEGFPKDGTQINTREIPTYMAHIPPDKKQWIGQVLQPMMEEW
eukprot:CAMPEP_0201570378 /NCGR_PEP_ID=MMETSP0190_2-20130828/12608_1 /ASSEMBLY_ACC=CAM_ASM_000263 /TAXON_ID=37353 /ORGANISM="Rosalina sp." /LENGTH=334 /DNA_ID=CAMNT_0047993853 /DNA_START=117 /DNA_END=1118 /DNA_ORIENTATION=-